MPFFYRRMSFFWNQLLFEESSNAVLPGSDIWPLLQRNLICNQIRTLRVKIDLMRRASVIYIHLEPFKLPTQMGVFSINQLIAINRSTDQSRLPNDWSIPHHQPNNRFLLIKNNHSALVFCQFIQEQLHRNAIWSKIKRFQI